MLRRSILCLLAPAVLCAGADDPWNKVKELRSGSELRIIRQGAKQPILAKMDEATDEKLSVVVQNSQISIPKAEIERIDARPVQTGPRVKKESKITTSNPDRVTPPYQGPSGGGSTVSSSSGLSIGGKPDFELVYRRQIFPRPAAPAAQK